MTRGLTILSVAYSLATVGLDSVGGAEQVLAVLDAELTARGHRSIVVAREGSSVVGTLVPVPAFEGALDAAGWGAVHERQAHAVAEAVARFAPDVVHMHGLDFADYLPPADIPLLCTLHLPPAWYRREIFELPRPGLQLHCVSRSQARSCPPSPLLGPAIENGVPLERLSSIAARRDFVLALGRICPEKGLHHALDAARLAGVPLRLCGRVFAFEAHRRYFADEIAPRLDGERRFLGPVGLPRKRRLLSAARCLLVPSLAPETSSLVAMEALACGTPVVAFPSGALPEIVEHGVTGFLVRDTREMAEAIESASAIDPEMCRAAARERFSSSRMVSRYVERYEQLARGAA